MKTLSQWLSAYGESHQNPINQQIHQVAVPGIFVSSVGLIWSLPSLTIWDWSINWVWLVSVPVLIFYFRLSLMVFMMMLGFTLASVALVWSMTLLQWPVLLISLCGFAFLWLLQFIGHKIEGKRPSFLEDLQFLLIGPVWVFRKK